jgi:hypothetical protein
MLRTRFIGVVFASVLTFGAFGQEVVVRVAPPHPLVEERVIAPGPGYVWIAGYHRWDGAAYVWTPESGKRLRILTHTGLHIAGPPAWWMGAGGRALALGLPAAHHQYRRSNRR